MTARLIMKLRVERMRFTDFAERLPTT